MNEQEYMNKIKNQAEQVPIPESISPENMKKLLDEQVATTKNNPRQKQSFSKKRWITNACVACAALFLVCGISYTIFNPISKNTSDVAANSTQEDALEMEDAKTDVSESGDELLAYETTMNTPNSYDEYYDTIKSVYDAYYDQFAIVESEGNDDMLTGTPKQKEYSVFREENQITTDLAAVAEDASLNSAGAATKDFSTTNTQEENVDEADIIKTDGDYIYKSGLTEKNGEIIHFLSIIKADNGKMELESTINLDECINADENSYIYFREFYLYKDYLLLIFTNNSEEVKTNIVVYDIKDRQHPKQQKIFSQSGGYEGSRISDGYLYTISVFSDMDFSSAKPYDNYIPCINDNLIECDKIYYPDDALVESTYVITSLDIENLTTTDSKAVPTNGGGLYVSENSIYIYGNIYADTVKTEILRIAYDKGSLNVGKSAVLSGYLYGSFALNEYDNHLRVVATIPANNISLLRIDIPEEMNDDTTSAEETELQEDMNVLYIFNESMELTGKIAGIAPGEQIKSARFLGEIGYLVTYENTDPLFSIDLSNPENPEIIGKLTIPGFSEYLHPYANGIMLGIGQETNPENQAFEGLKLSMFDISNPEDVKVVNQYVIENANYSPAEYNHRALMIDTDKNIFGFYYQEFVYNETDYTYNNTDYYVTYQYDKKNGFTETGRYKLDTKSYEYENIRGLYIDDYLYISTTDSVVSYELNGDTKIDKITG